MDKSTPSRPLFFSVKWACKGNFSIKTHIIDYLLWEIVAKKENLYELYLNKTG